jgi:hypothetical protein
MERFEVIDKAKSIATLSGGVAISALGFKLSVDDLSFSALEATRNVAIQAIGAGLIIDSVLGHFENTEQTTSNTQLTKK